MIHILYAVGFIVVSIVLICVLCYFVDDNKIIRDSLKDLKKLVKRVYQ